jgi:hypothetical protein
LKLRCAPYSISLDPSTFETAHFCEIATSRTNHCFNDFLIVITPRLDGGETIRPDIYIGQLIRVAGRDKAEIAGS